MSSLFVNKTLRLNNLKTRTAMNAKISVFVIFAEMILYLLLYNLHDCTFNSEKNSWLKRIFSTLEKILNSGENSQLKRKFSVQEKNLNLEENYQLRKKILVKGKWKTLVIVKSFINKYSSKFSSPQEGIYLKT